MKTHLSTDAAPGDSANGEVERAYIQILEWLVDAVLPPGSFLSEPDLARRCSTSRTPIREACMRLMQDRWLIRFPQKGFMVTPISVAEIVDLYQYRILLEVFAVEKAAQSIDVERIEELESQLVAERSSKPDVATMILANESFHLKLAQWAGNERVLEQLRLTLRFARRLDTLYLQVDRSWIPHEDILSALLRHSSVDAGRAMSAHLEHSQECLIKMFGRQGRR